MTDLNVRTAGMYVVGALIIAACFWLIATTPGEHVQEWATITGLIGYLIRDAGGAAGTRAAEKVLGAQPAATATTSTGTASITPTDADGDGGIG